MTIINSLIAYMYKTTYEISKMDCAAEDNWCA